MNARFPLRTLTLAALLVAVDSVHAQVSPDDRPTPESRAGSGRQAGSDSSTIAASSASKLGELVTFGVGCSVRLPTGWTYKEDSEGVMFLPPGVRFDPARKNNPEAYFLAVRNDHAPADESDVVRDLSAAVRLTGGSGGQRRPAKFGSRAGALYQWDFRDPQSGILAGLDIYFATEDSRAVLMLAAGENARIRAQETNVRQILSSVVFAKTTLSSNTSRADSTSSPASTSLADATPLAQRWLAKLRGKVVRQFWASQGMSSDKRHWLNGDGTYAFKSSSMVSVDVSGASGLSTGKDNSSGRWQIRDVAGKVFLEVRYNDGTVRRMAITEDNRNWYLNGEKAFAVNP